MKIAAILALIVGNIVAFLGQAYMLRALFESQGSLAFIAVCLSQIIVILSVARLIDRLSSQEEKW